jgi:glucan biosynthesis protein C
MTTRTMSAQRVETSIARPAAASATVRLAFLDNLKVALTALVIAHHAGQAYGPTGGSWPIFSPERSAVLGPFFGVNAAFFMGLFFLISAYFVPRAFDRKGAATFLGDRFRRLGIPVLLWALLVSGPIAYFSQDAPGSLWQFLGSLYPGKVADLFSHLWFVGHLLVYALGYALWRWLARYVKLPNAADIPVPTQRGLLAFTLLLGVVSAIVRIWYPIDRWATVLVVPAEVAHLPQYISLFVLGIVAYRADWLRRLPTATGMTWLGIGLTASVARYAYDLGGWRWLPPFPGAIEGLIMSTWEAFICVGLSMGLVVLFRERFNGQPGRLLSAMGGAAYAAYVFHLLVVVALQFSLVEVPLPPLAKFALVTLVGVPLSFGIGYLQRKCLGARAL